MAELDHINVDGVLYEFRDAKAYQKPNEGIPPTDFTQSVQNSLGLANTALQPDANFDPKVDTVWNKTQTLNSSQKQQARNNIGAGVVNTVTVNGRTFQSADGDVNLGTISGGGGEGGDVNIIESISVNGATQPISNKNVDITVPTRISDLSQDSTHRLVSDTDISAWTAKQDTISDLTSIRSGASLGSTAYQKPSTGIPKTDLSQEVQNALDNPSITSETDPVFTASPAYNITSSNISSWNAKQNTLTFDTTPTANSTNPVTSAGIKAYVDNATPTITMDDTPTSGSNNPVKSGGIYTALQGKQNTLTFDSTPTASSTNPVTSGGVKTALDLKANQSTTYTKTEVDALFDDVAYLGDDDGTATTLPFDPQADTVWNIPQTLGSSQQAQARANIGVVDVSGTNDGTNWTSITIGSTTKAIPSGGGGGSVTVDSTLSTTSTNPVQNAVITTALNGKEDNSNKVTSLSSSSTDTQYPSAKCVYDIIGDIESLLAAI